MSTSVIEPGTRLAGRYRLEERIRDSGGSSLWKAIDEILARAVAVRTFDPENPRIADVVTSARAASRLTDPRLTQVFDADDSGESAYVVSEWVVGETLEVMLGKAPLEPGRAATLLYEAAEAIAAAHAAGLSHLCLTPRDLVWTTGGTVKILGIATDAVLGDRHSDDPAGDDVRGLGRMLYAALTAHWPGDDDRSDLPAAPATDGVPHAPRQVQAGISHAIDAIVCRCLGIGPGEPLATPADLAKALRGVPRTPLPLFAGLGHPQPPTPRPAPPAGRPNAPHPPSHRRGAAPAPRTSHHHQPAPPPETTVSSHVPPPRTRNRPEPPPPASAATRPARAAHGAPRRFGNRALLGVAAAALTVIVGLGAWALMGGDSENDPGTTGVADPKRSSAPPTPSATELDIQSAAGIDPVGQDGGKGPEKGRLAIDGKDGTVWRSSYYTSPEFGNLKEGVGLLLDMGRPVTIKEVKARLPESAGATIQLKVGNSSDPSAMQKVQTITTSRSGSTSVKFPSPRTAQYVLLWFTKLSNGSDGQLRAEVSEVTVLGSRN
ncbi:AMP-binding protein [Actinomadura spongiicola]|uniref:AMP-binding protein n=1 Tax=Actinomadura spongiicola TaxID=2303421 RepID=A0A372GNG5_9ACTN|nr:protein kinase family protein [Actinomadura spongiicola]RFS86947.1 AMP-binding protein [Actinomadura spongiicola]